jgi:hypothetical protein
VAGGRAGNPTLGSKRGDAAIVWAALDHRPRVCRVVATDLDDAVAVRGQLHLALLAGQFGEFAFPNAGEHQVIVGVLEIDAQQAVPGARRALRQRHPADEVVVIAPLQGLLRSGLLQRIERRRTLNQRIAPADQRLGLVAGRDRVRLGVAVRHFLEGERRRRRLRLASKAIAERCQRRQRRHRSQSA